MIEVLLLCFLLWLWVIERRLNALNNEVRTLRLDVDGVRALRRAPDVPPSEPVADLPEVSTLGRSAGAVRKAAGSSAQTTTSAALS